MKRAISCCCLALVACGGFRQPSEIVPERHQAVAFELPEPVPAAPTYVARFRRPLRKPELKDIARIPGIAVLAPAHVRTARVRGPRGMTNLRLAMIDPLAFRSFSPRVLRDAEFVWTALLSGRAVITFEGAKKLGLRHGGRVVIRGRGFDVGALIEQVVPDIADVVVSSHSAGGLQMGTPNVLVIGAEPGSVKALGRHLERRLPAARLRRMVTAAPASSAVPSPPEVHQASGAAIGTMRFRILDNGFIEPDASWVAANIVTASVPVLGTVRCHRIMIPQLAAALSEIHARGLGHQIRPGDYQGCYVPRFIDRDPRRGLSMHAFGLAVDLNVSTNGFGHPGDMHPDVVRIFERWGFEWGGRWSPPDPMHFELARIVNR